MEDDGKLSADDVNEVLQWFVDQKLNEAQKIENLRTDYKNESRQSLLKRGVDIIFVPVAVVVGIGLGWILFHSANEGPVD